VRILHSGAGQRLAARPSGVLGSGRRVHTAAATVQASRRPWDTLGNDDKITPQVDLVTLALAPLGLIQLAGAPRLGFDGQLERHRGLRRAVIAAIDLHG
jgi:hypothetical protein